MQSGHVGPVTEGPTFHEQWALDDLPEFVQVPERLAELLESPELSVDARVALFIDAAGGVARVEVQGMIDPGVAADLSAVLHEASFVPGRLAGEAVPSVKRFEWRLLAPGTRIVSAHAAAGSL